MLIWSVLSLFGLWIAHRTLFTCERFQILSAYRMNQWRLFIFLTVVGINFFFRHQIQMLFGLAVVISMSPWWVPFLIERHRERLLKEQFLPLLDQLILLMRTGKAFRTAFASCLERSDGSVRHLLNEFYSAIQYQKETRDLSADRKIKFFFQELAQVDQTTHRPLERLKALRRRLAIEKNFRQKSRQALLQVRFQSWMMSAMYLMVLIYIHFDHGLLKHFGLVVFSASFFVFGLLWVQNLGRNYRWKI